MTAMTRPARRSALRLAAAVAGGGALALTILPGAGTAAPAPSACSPDWPMYQHDASRTGAACAAGVTTANAAMLVPAWQARTASPVTATPTVAGRSVFVGDAGGVFYALDRSTGTPRWTFNITSTDRKSVV